jgi:hypothetical protein
MRTDLIEAYADYDDEELFTAINRVLLQNYKKDRLVIRDKTVEDWARDNDIEMVNEL